MPATHQEARPRTVGEILDDAWRLYLNDAPLLLSASGLFLVPAVAVLLVLLTEPFPTPGWTRSLAPALAALLLPLTGLGAGACEEAFHLGTEGKPAPLSACLRAALRRGLGHVTSEALVLLFPMLALLCLVNRGTDAGARGFLATVCLLLALPVWVVGLCRHAVLTAGQPNLRRAWRLSRRCSARHFSKVVVLLLARLLLFVCAAVNLHLFLVLALYAGEQLAGLDLAYPRLLLRLGNPIYLVTLCGLTWWLLAPYNEAVTYLFLVDARTRYDGLDLWFRIEQSFPLGRAGKAGVLLLAAGALLLAAGPVQGSTRLRTVREARVDLAAVAREMKEAEPYPGGKEWQEQLETIGDRLDAGGARQGRYRWYFQALEKLGDKDRSADLKVLRELDARLAVVEDSLKWQPQARRRTGGGHAPAAADIRRLVPPDGTTSPKEHVKKEKPPAEKEPPPQKEPQRQEGGVRVAGPGVADAVGPMLGVLGQVCLYFFLVLLAAVLVAGVVLLVRNWLQNRPREKPGQQGVSAPAAEDFLAEPDKENVAGLWRQSDELARAGRFLEAVRTLYLAVLALLHQAHLIRYERTRTNGEYADQLRRQGTPVQRPFLSLTGLFEVKWYGERSCQEGDYQACRGLAEAIQSGVRSEV
jgi:hypothetical protein